MVGEWLSEEHERDKPEHNYDQSDREDREEHAHDRSFLLPRKVVPIESVTIRAFPDCRQQRLLSSFRNTGPAQQLWGRRALPVADQALESGFLGTEKRGIS